MGRARACQVHLTHARSRPARTNQAHSLPRLRSHPRARPPADRPLQPPGKNWPKAVEKRHSKTAVRRVTALGWNRHETTIAPKMILWFEVIGRVLRDPAILAENVYDMDETRVMPSMHGSAKVLVGKDIRRKYRGARVKRTTGTAVECIAWTVGIRTLWFLGCYHPLDQLNEMKELSATRLIT